MQKKDCLLVGSIFKLHGYKGDVNIYNDNNIPFNFSELEYFFIEIDSELVPYFIEKARFTKPNIILVKFEYINSEKEAKKIQKQKVYLPKDWIPKANKKEITGQKLIGYSIVDINQGDLGKITFINSQTAQQVIYVRKDEKEFCFPMHKQFVKEINSKERIMKVKIPEELLNLN